MWYMGTLYAQRLLKAWDPQSTVWETLFQIGQLALDLLIPDGAGRCQNLLVPLCSGQGINTLGQSCPSILPSPVPLGLYPLLWHGKPNIPLRLVCAHPKLEDSSGGIRECFQKPDGQMGRCLFVCFLRGLQDGTWVDRLDVAFTPLLIIAFLSLR